MKEESKKTKTKKNRTRRTEAIAEEEINDFIERLS